MAVAALLPNLNPAVLLDHADRFAPRHHSILMPAN